MLVTGVGLVLTMDTIITPTPEAGEFYKQKIMWNKLDLYMNTYTYMYRYM